MLVTYLLTFGQPDTNSYVKGKVWIGLKQPLKAVNKQEFKRTLKAEEKDTLLFDLCTVRKVFNSDDKNLGKIYELSFKHEKELVKHLKKYKEYIDYVEYIPKFQPDEDQYTPNDFIDDPDTLWHIDHLGLREAWYLMQGISNRTKIAIIDNGYDGDHEDLIDNINFIESGADNNGNHGTRVAGIAGMSTNNGKGYCSVSGEFSDLYLYFWGNPDDIRDAADRGCRVINMSFRHGYSPLQTYINAINYAYNKDVLMIASGGNCTFPDTVNPCIHYQYPACYDHVMSIAALIEDDTKRYNSSYYDKIDISAPGNNIVSTAEDNSYSFTCNSTSAAAPIVSGVASLLFAINPIFTPDEVEYILEATAYDIYQISKNQPYIDSLGAGRVDAYNSVLCAKNLSSPLALTGPLDGTYNKYFINIDNATTNGGVTIHTKGIEIDGPFEVRSGDSFIIDNNITVSCQ